MCPVAESRLGVLVDGDNDGLDVLVAVALHRRPMPQLGERLNPRWIVGVMVVSLGALT